MGQILNKKGDSYFHLTNGSCLCTIVGMPRAARIVLPGEVHHISQHGNNREDVFFDDEDREVYLETLGEQAEKFGLTLLGYCLMPNHVHILGVPEEEASLAKTLGSTHLLYTQHINRAYERSGHLWQQRFRSCAMDEDHFWAALRYIERNPVRSELAESPWEYAWSSAAVHTGEAASDPLVDMAVWEEWAEGVDWKAFLGELDDEDDLKRLRGTTGRPLGNDEFLDALEEKLGRRVRALPRGRPRRK